VNWVLALEPEAEAEIAEARDWYDRRSPGLAPSLLVPSTRCLRRSSKTLSNIKLYGDNFAVPGFADSLTA
jgi:hypothetical protein